MLIDPKSLTVPAMKAKLFRKRCFYLMMVLLLQWGLPQIVIAGASATGQATATVSEPLDIQMTEELEFGQIRPGGTAGTVVVAPEDNARTATGGTELGPGNATLHHRAKFDVSGTPDAFFNIALSSSPAVHDQGINPSLQVTDLKSFSETRGIVTLTGKTNGIGEDIVYVGGTLQVPANALNGKYEGDVTITVNF
ncbi:MAG: hypothetical protein NPINA01_09130 [Nitrospinaceae bacterium]|nr:MAG: hypothetical protein NPINA01_09130 [Nitrospinaceae bacterium]